MRDARSLWFGLLSAVLVSGSVWLSSTAAEPRRSAAPSLDRPSMRCDGAIQHPISVRAAALGPVRRGGTARVRVITSTRRPLEGGEVRLVSTGGATLAGAARVPFGRLDPGMEATSEFAVDLPAEGRRFLLQFRVTGTGRNGIESRGASFNLLPDGPADPGRVVTTGTGERIAEYRAVRIDQ